MPHKSPGWLFWPILLALLGLSGYGFFSERLMSQQIWNPLGWQRLLLLIAVYGALTAICYRWAPGRFVSLLLTGAGLYTVGSVGWQGPVAAIFVLVSSLLTGDLLLGISRSPKPSTGRLADALLSLLVGLSLYITAIGVAAHFPVNYRFVYLTALTAPLVLNRRGLAYYARGAAGWLSQTVAAPASWLHFAARALLAFILLAHLLVALKPEVSFDGLAMHLFVPTSVEYYHRFSFNFHDVVWALMPLGGDWAHTAAYLIGGEYGARLLNFLLLVVVAGLLYAVARRWLPAPWSMLVATVFVSTPIVQLVTGSLFVENLLAALTFGAVLALERFRRTLEPRYLIGFAIMLGATLSVKLAGFAIVLTLGLFALEAMVRARRAGTLGAGSALVALGCFLACGLPAYGYAWVVTGNPVYPFENATFKSPYYPSDVSFSNTLFNTRLSWSTPYEITFRSHKFLESQDGSLGFLYLVLIPLSLLALGRGYPYLGWLSLTGGLSLYVAVFVAQPYLRYFYPALPLLLAPVAILLASLRRQPRLRLALGAVAVSGVFLNLYFLPASGWYHKDFFLATLFGSDQPRQYIQQYAPVRPLVEYLNLTAPGAPVGFFKNEQISGLWGNAFADSWHDPEYERELRACRSPAEVLRLARKYRLLYFVAPGHGAGVEEPIRSFLHDYTAAEYSSGGFSVARLRNDVMFVSQTLQNPDFKEGLGGWQMNGAVAYDRTSHQVRVTAKDTLVQAVAVTEGVLYRYSITARCEEPGNQLRLQVNWHDRQGKFLTTSLYPEECAASFRTHTKDMTPSAAATLGVVFVAGHTAEPVIVKGISFTF